MFVIVEFNQASRRPSIQDEDVFDNLADALEYAQDRQAEIFNSGRGETVEVYRLEPLDDEDEDADDVGAVAPQHSTSVAPAGWRYGDPAPGLG